LQAETRIEIAWFNQPGRVPSIMDSIADGFLGSSAIAAAAVVGENARPGSGYAEKAIAVFRDAFAEGVAYGVEDVFADAVSEIEAMLRDAGSDSFSLAAAAAIGNEVWVYSRGTCLVFLSGVDSDGGYQNSVTELSGMEIQHLILKPGHSIILLSYTLRKLMRSVTAVRYSARCRKPLSVCLSDMISETRIRFRKKGGSAAAVRLCSNSRRIKLPGKRFWLLLITITLAAAAVFTLCLDTGDRSAPAGTDTLRMDEVVMPL
jgi:hypothetical protein